MAALLRLWRAPVVLLRPGVLGSRVFCAREAGGRLPSLFLQLPAPSPGVTAASRLLSRGAGPDAAEGSERNPGRTQQLRRVFREYGAAGVAFHIGLSLTSLGIFYILVSSGLDVSALLLRVGFSESVVESRLAAGTSTFVLAYAIHKLFAPLRISITVVSVPFLVRYLRRAGIFRPPPPPPPPS